MVRPGDEPVAGGKGHAHMRASRADRDRVLDLLKGAFIQERLAKDELDDRIGRALAARTWADLDSLIADLPAAPYPARLPPAGPPRAAARAPAPPAPGLPPAPSASRPMKALVAAMATVIVASGVSGSVLAGPGPGVVITGLVAGVVFVALWVVACISVIRERPPG
jgi:hypothetical protein